MVIAEASKASNSRQRFMAMTVDLGRSRNRNRTAIFSKVLQQEITLLDCRTSVPQVIVRLALATR